MSLYHRARKEERVFLSLTGLQFAEFDTLLPFFQAAWKAAIETAYQQDSSRKRKPGGGQEPALNTPEKRLFFILYYLKTYPLQEVMAFHFEMSQGQANEWIHRLTRMLQAALDQQGASPERLPEQVQATAADTPEREFVIDGTERARQRPQDPAAQSDYYSGKKKKHTVKNNLIVGVKDRLVKYLGQTHEGKKHDKKICDEEQPTYPEGSRLLQDTGFQGYAPPGVIIYQPKKKPKGKELSEDDKESNALISKVRIMVEHVIAGVKRLRIVKEVFRNTKEHFDDLVMEIACGLHNFRTVERSKRAGFG
jgi:hypothetical protein